MPLTRATVTAASRIMLPAYVIHATWFGLVYFLDPQGRVSRNPSLTAARVMLPMWAWGLLFLGLAVMMVVAMASHRRNLEVYALMIYATANVVWALVYFAALFLSPDASFNGPAASGLVACACIASTVSLLRREI